MTRNTQNFLLEIGTEELPTDSLDLLEAHFRARVEAKLREERLTFDNSKVFTTPRRVVLFIQGLAPRQEAEVAEWVGPSWDKAYDELGKPTPALEGFLRSKNLSEKDIVKKEIPRGIYAAAQKTLAGKRAEQILPGLFAELLTSFSFPKTMRWDATRFSFPRPIRWIVSVLDSKVLSFSVASVRANRFTFGHRFLAPRKLAVKKADAVAFIKLLEKAHVVLDLEERKRRIRQQFAARAGQGPCEEELVHVTAQLVEEPYVITGKFSPDFLSLPPEILSTSMKKHQKIFAVYDAGNKLKPLFAGVLNGRKTNLSKIIKDYQGVLEAKLRDAQFFYAEDTKEPLERKVEKLNGIIFLSKLGTMQDKTNRLVELAAVLAQGLKLPADQSANLKRAAFLCKADLLTHMVYEFPELQGVMGREYAKANGESVEVAGAIAEHYLPKTLSQSYLELEKEQTCLGSLLAILEKIDTLVGAFGVGFEPTGSQDPYALRRAAGGVVKIIRAFSHRFDLKEIIQTAVRLYGSRLSKSETEILIRLEAFFRERMAFELGAAAGSKEDQILKAVLKTSWSDVGSVFLRYDLLKSLYGKDRAGFDRAHKVIERTHNILKGASNIQEEIKADLLKEKPEQKLYDLVQGKISDFDRLAREEKFDKATHLYGEVFYEPVHEFFDKVLVNVEDLPLRENRRALMKKINRIYVDYVADLSLVNQQD